MRTALLIFPLVLLACSAPVDKAPAEENEARDTTVFTPTADTLASATILVYGRIKDAETGEGLRRFHIRLEDALTGALVDSATVVDDSASYELELDYGRSFHLHYSADGYTTKSLVVDARDLSEDNGAGGFSMHMNVGLVQRLQGVDYTMLDEPLGRAHYSEESTAIVWDTVHLAQRQYLLERLMVEQARVRSRMTKR